MEECPLELAVICAELVFLFRKARQGAIFKKFWNYAIMAWSIIPSERNQLGKTFRWCTFDNV
jgi:hypothetical protein